MLILEQFILFEKLCKKHFRFLVNKFSFDSKYIIEKTNIQVNILYKNETTGIKISYEPRDGGIFVALYKLIEGKFPEYRDNSDVIFEFDGLLYLRAKQKIERVNNIELKETKEIKKTFDLILELYAKKINKYAVDVLKGDFSIFSDLYSRKKKWIELNHKKRFNEISSEEYDEIAKEMLKDIKIISLEEMQKVRERTKNKK